MATATAATTVAVAAAASAAKIINRGRISLSIRNHIGTVNIIQNRQFIRKTSSAPTPAPFLSTTNHNRFIHCFCTTAANNVEEEPTTASVSTATATPSSSESKSSSDGDKDNESGKLTEAAKMLDIRVGRIIKAWRHEEADSLYVEEVDVGEAEPRIICSGLVKYIPIDHLQDRKVVVLANLKARNMRGVKSNGMLMAASDASHENVELLEPHPDSLPGERIWFGSQHDQENQLPEPASPNQVQKKKIWESVQPHLKTDDSCQAMVGEHLLQTSAGVVVCRSLKNANIS
ncbi:uncharacterized protein LOC126685776 [Mercurialis annua]|uniref:uncharacterized protein LOC126685776 n=1 Tax=Mercurialis annua TaxID=3986 RepID=UPI002160DABD|nr:uncharacterized protein LOC126685776 [Mercurialis annua]